MTKSDTTADAVNAMKDAMAQLQKMGLSSMTWMGTDWMEQMNDLGSEVLSFIADRIHKDVEFQHRLLHCKDPAELHRIQAEFWQEAIDQYTEETGKLIEMGSRGFADRSGADD